MTRPESVPQAIWDTLTAEAQACFAAVIGRLEQRITDLEARLNQNSTNSSRPPSSDPPGLKRKPPMPTGRRRRGGQPGHPKAQRAMVPPEKLASVTACKPPACRRCRRPLEGDDPDPLIHQVAEWPVVEPVVHEYRRHRLRCPGCGETTCGVLPRGVPAGAFGPRLQATLGLLSGAYRPSKRQVQQLARDLLGLRIAVGMIAKLERQSAATLEGPVDRLRASVIEAPVVHIDETSWRRDRKKVWLWITATGRATVFTIAVTRAASVARTLLGTERPQVVISDRLPGYDWIAVGDRQVCWAHLRRDFQAMIDRGGVSEPIGRELLDASNRLFRWWHRVRDGTLERSALVRLVGRVRAKVEPPWPWVNGAAAAGPRGPARSCRRSSRPSGRS